MNFMLSPLHALRIAIIALLVMLAPTLVSAADPKIEFETSFEPSSVRPGEHTVFRLSASIPAGYHFYSQNPIEDGPIALEIPLEDPSLEPASQWFAPVPKVEFDKNFEKDVEFYSGSVAHERSFKVVGTEAGEKTIKFKLRGQFCDDQQCMLVSKKFEVSYILEEGEVRPEYANPAVLEGQSFPSEIIESSGGGGGKTDLLKDGLGSYLVTAFIAGLLALLTPCVFPMIPITVGFFSKFSKISMRRTVSMASIYAISIIGTFVLVGVLVSLIFGAVGMGAISSSIFFNAFIAILLLVFSYNLWGLFEIQMPSFLIAKTSQREHELKNEEGSFGKQALGVFFMGLTFTLISFTCTVSFIGVVLARAAEGDWFYPAIGMFTFALAFALPFFLLAIFPSWAEGLKGKAGDWMVSVKVMLGFLEFVGAFKFISNIDLFLEWGVFTRPFVLSIWTATFFVAGLYLLRIMRLGDDHEPRAVSPVRMSFAMVMFMIAIYSSTGIRDTKSMGGWVDGWLPPAVYPGDEGMESSGGGSEHLTWLKDDIPGGMDEARRDNKPLFLDYTGYACTNCRFMEASVFPRPKIRSQLEKMARVSVYTDCKQDICDEQRETQLKRYDTIALPFYVIINPHDDTVLATFASMTNEPSEFEAFLKKGIAKFEAVKPSDKPETVAKSDESATNNKDTEHEGKSESKFANITLDLATSGDPVDFSFPGLADGVPLKLSALRGDWVFVNYWASWCAPCKKELKNDFPPALATAPQMKVLTVAFDGEDTKDQSIKFAKEIDLFKYPTLQGGEDIEEAGLPELMMGGATLPQSYLIHPEGYVAWSHVGSVDEHLLIRLFAKTKI